MTGRRLVMWDIDWTLLHTGGVTWGALRTAFQAVTGRPLDRKPEFAGRTDLSIVAEVFGWYDLTAPDLTAFFARFAAELTEVAHLIPEQGRLLPGAREVLTALAERDELVQTAVTGNIAANAHTKLAAFDLAAPLDLTVGGYGDDHLLRAELVATSRRRAGHRYGEFTEVVVIGDTRHDIAAALACGVTAIGVASGKESADALRAAGAHAVLDSLEDVPTVIALLTGRSGT